ncbi:MAG: single-stranded DNA-binding protein [bacterium]|nr:single-stranded DNA-binding protein [bacterium]
MASRSLNKVMLIGNLTRDPELRYTPTGAAVCTIGLATNRYWTTEAGEKKDEVEFHRVVAWNKLAELCSQLLVKGRKIYVEGRLRTNTWQAQDGSSRSTTEVVIEDMILLDAKRQTGDAGGDTGDQHGGGDTTPGGGSTQAGQVQPAQSQPVTPSGAPSDAGEQVKEVNEDVNPDDIPF